MTSHVLDYPRFLWRMLAASIEGQSTILNAAPIKRAHPRFVENLNALGADVEWVYGD